MTERETVTEAMVEIAARGIAASNECETLGACPPAVCECRRDARAALEAALPLLVAGERERCARIADMYAEVNIEAAGDTILLDPVLSGRNRISPAAHEESEDLRIDGCIHSSMFHAAQNIAAAIRADKGGGGA